jgi:hypothetical protein
MGLRGVLRMCAYAPAAGGAEGFLALGARHGLNMRPPLSKPFRAGAIRHFVTSAHLAESTSTVVDLG